jgi:DNA helicase-2/ATP-dependent DNA helicase PcrA
MKDRLNGLIGNNSTHVSTIHSLSYHLLRKITKLKYEVIDDYKKYLIFKKIIEDRKLPTAIAGRFINAIDRIKNEYIFDEEINYERYVGGSMAIELMEFYNDYEYQKQIMTPRGIDFDDMMILFLREVLKDENIKHKCSKIWDYILVDEFQDTSYIQAEIIKILSANTNNLFAVGDYSQSIYGFRGAKPEYMINFSDYFGSCSNVF